MEDKVNLATNVFWDYNFKDESKPYVVLSLKIIHVMASAEGGMLRNDQTII